MKNKNVEQDFELTMFDRIETIKTVNKQYDLENNAYISFSGGKDSTVLHYLIDMALPNNRIPRVFINTGIEYNYIVEFVKELAEKDDRFVILKPTQAIKPMLEKYGYPFKSKQHSHNLAIYQNQENIIDCDDIDKVREQGIPKTKIIQEPYCEPREVKYIDYNIPLTLVRYLGVEETTTKFRCPNILLHQFSSKFNLKCSDKCCYKLKKEPAKKWEKENNKSITLTGMRRSEGGERASIGCIVTDKEKNLVKFHPLLVVDDEFENWFIEKNNIKLCKLYYEPFNFKRTGCKGCPFALGLQEQLDVMERLLPNEAKQCEIIWKPVYDEYRRIGYRLAKNKQTKLF